MDSAEGRAQGAGGEAEQRLSDELERWLRSDSAKTLGSLIELFGTKSFAIVFVVLMAVPALPLPTGGVTHVLELITMLVALQLILNRDEVWLPQRWRGLVIAGERQERLLNTLMRIIRRLERISRPRLTFVFGHRLSNVVFGVLVIGGSVGAFLAPPFSGLDTLPALGVVLLSLGVLLEDVAVVVVGVAVAAAGVGLEIILGRAAVRAVENLF
jgi:hypothetical protein